MGTRALFLSRVVRFNRFGLDHDGRVSALEILRLISDNARHVA